MRFSAFVLILMCLTLFSASIFAQSLNDQILSMLTTGASHSLTADALTCAEGSRQCNGLTSQICTGGVWTDYQNCAQGCANGYCNGIAPPPSPPTTAPTATASASAPGSTAPTSSTSSACTVTSAGAVVSAPGYYCNSNCQCISDTALVSGSASPTSPSITDLYPPANTGIFANSAAGVMGNSSNQSMNVSCYGNSNWADIQDYIKSNGQYSPNAALASGQICQNDCQAKLGPYFPGEQFACGPQCSCINLTEANLTNSTGNTTHNCTNWSNWYNYTYNSTQVNYTTNQTRNCTWYNNDRICYSNSSLSINQTYEVCFNWSAILNTTKNQTGNTTNQTGNATHNCTNWSNWYNFTYTYLNYSTTPPRNCTLTTDSRTCYSNYSLSVNITNIVCANSTGNATNSTLNSTLQNVSCASDTYYHGQLFNNSKQICRNDCNATYGSNYTCASNCTCVHVPIAPPPAVIAVGCATPKNGTLAPGVICADNCNQTFGSNYYCASNCTCAYRPPVNNTGNQTHNTTGNQTGNTTLNQSFYCSGQFNSGQWTAGHVCKDDCALDVGANYTCSSNCTCVKKTTTNTTNNGSQNSYCSSGIKPGPGGYCIDNCAPAHGNNTLWKCQANCTCVFVGAVTTPSTGSS